MVISQIFEDYVFVESLLGNVLLNMEEYCMEWKNTKKFQIRFSEEVLCTLCFQPVQMRTNTVTSLYGVHLMKNLAPGLMAERHLAECRLVGIII